MSGSLDREARRRHLVPMWCLAGATGLVFLTTSMAFADTATDTATGPCTPSGTAPGFCGDDGPATSARLAVPHGVAVTKQGGFLIADSGNDRVRSVAPNGVITTIAGNGRAGSAGDGLPATDAELHFPTAVAIASDGGILIADNASHRIRRIGTEGRITTVAGTGTAGFSGDRGPAVDATLNYPSDIAPQPDGGFLIADPGNSRIRRVGPNGTIVTVAGSGTAGFAGDGGPATAAQLSQPTGVVVSGNGFLIADTGNHRVRFVDGNGVISTVAGNGSAGAEGDGASARNASLNAPTGVATLSSGGFVIADSGNNTVRRVDSQGVITTLAGTGTAGFAGDGGPAAQAMLRQPAGVATAGDVVFVADLLNNRVRRIQSGAIATVAGTGFAIVRKFAALQMRVNYPLHWTLLMASHRLKARSHRPIRVSYMTTQRASLRLEIRRVGSKKATVVVRQEALSTYGQIRIKALRPGRYSLRLLGSYGNARQSDSARLRVLRR